VGGTFELSSQPGAGTSVRIGLTDCLDEVESPIMRPADSRRTHRDDQEIGRKGIRVLVVEDHPVTRRGIMQLLSEHVDLNLVGEAGDGQTALAMAALTKPDVVIMDVVMPGMSGIDATRSIKSEHPGITVIGFSMHNEEDVRRRMIQAGASAYVVKDEAVEQLVKTVRGCCPRRQAGSTGLFDSACPSE
jgi:CheY-like chemotaxis protein